MKWILDLWILLKIIEMKLMHNSKWVIVLIMLLSLNVKAQLIHYYDSATGFGYTKENTHVQGWGTLIMDYKGRIMEENHYDTSCKCTVYYNSPYYKKVVTPDKHLKGVYYVDYVLINHKKRKSKK
jgi:hypothetical protein